MANPADAYRSAADNIVRILRRVMPADDCELGEAISDLCQQANKLRQDGQLQSATECCEAGRRMVRQLYGSTGTIASRFAEGFVLMHIGAICLTCQRLEPTLECFRQAIDLFRGCNRCRSQSVAWMAIGDTYRLTQDWEKAMNAFQHSLNLLKSLRPTDLTTIELKEHIEAKLDESRSAFVAGIAPGQDNQRTGAAVHTMPTMEPRPIPIVGSIAAGAGMIAEQDIEGGLLLDQEHARHAKFAVRVRGQSMIEAGIMDRDLALIREQPVVENGATAAVLILSQGQADAEGTLKRYHRESDHHRLEPRNANERTIIVIPMPADADRIAALYSRQGKQISVYVGEVRVIGKLVGIFREVD